MTNPDMDGGDNASTVAAAELRSFIERVERLEEERKAIADDIKDVMAESKGRGYDTRAIKAILKLRKMDPSERQEQDAIVELYKNVLGLA